MSKSFVYDGIRITLRKNGSTAYTKMSFPIHCGIYHEIETKKYIFQFTLNGEILRAKGKGEDWAHPHEWLKRTQGNDWVYYSTGGYTGVFEATGEYYLPNFQYPTNSVLGGHPFANEEICSIIDSWYNLLQRLQPEINKFPTDFQHFFENVLARTPKFLERKAQALHDIIGGRISVLPPDARHVDYNFIPLTVSKGCLYKCKFCKVKNGTVFSQKKPSDIEKQIEQLKEFYDKDLINYNSIFLGEHDALLADSDLILSSIDMSHAEFGFAHSYTHGCNTFLFGSVSSFLGKSEHFFQELEKLPGMTYINIGLESADQETLDRIGKPISERQVVDAFDRSQDINDRFHNVEITANFIMDENLPKNHYRKTLELIRERLPHVKPKGSIYFSPLTFDRPSRSRLFEFNRLKIKSRLPTYLYIIQRF